MLQDMWEYSPCF